MRYEIVGETLPAVICTLEEGETMITEKGAMSWMSPNMKMETSTNGGIGKAFGRMVFRRVDFPEHVYCKGRSRNDCICIQLSGKDRCT
mgnify:FL=1